MLSDEALDLLMDPIIKRQEEINTYIISQIAKRLKEVGYLKQSDLYKLDMLLKSGADTRKLNKELARLTNLQVKDIKRIIKAIAKDSYISAKPFYDYRNLSYIPFEKNVRLQRLVNSIAKTTANNYINLSNTTTIGFVTKELGKSKKVFKPLRKLYIDVIDRAIQSVAFGIEDYGTVIRHAINELITSGTRVQYESGRTERLDSAVRRNILDGMRAIFQEAQNEIGQQIKADGIELSVHYNSAPDHEPVQGHQFDMENWNYLQNGQDFQDYKGRKFKGFPRAIGMWNCRHLAYNIILGVNKPIYTDEELEKIKKENATGYTFPDGRHLTGYECLQLQNKIALQIRYAKDGQIASRLAGDMASARKYQAKVDRLIKDYNAFVKEVGLNPKRARTSVSNYKKINSN